MAKPSIFSRDYEKKMRRRRRRIFLTILAIVMLCLGIFVKIEFSNINFTKVKAKIQAWVDSGRPEDLSKDSESTKKQEAPTKKENEQKQGTETKKTYVNLNVTNSTVIKAEFVEINGSKKFVSIDKTTIPNGFTYSINPSGTGILIADTNQNLIMFDTSGTPKNVTKSSYTSKSGDVFTKDSILQSNPAYVWTSQARFIDDTRIAFVSYLPYFGDTTLNYYVWISDTATGTETCLWNYCAPQISLGEIVANKGLTMNINGTVYYVNGDGIVTQ